MTILEAALAELRSAAGNYATTIVRYTSWYAPTGGGPTADEISQMREISSTLTSHIDRLGQVEARILVRRARAHSTSAAFTQARRAYYTAALHFCGLDFEPDLVPGMEQFIGHCSEANAALGQLTAAMERFADRAAADVAGQGNTYAQAEAGRQR